MNNEYVSLSHKKKRIFKKKTLLISWLLLMVFTLISVVLGKIALDKQLMIATVLFTVFLKGHQIIDIFMELKYAPHKWRILLLGYVVILPAIIATIYMF